MFVELPQLGEVSLAITHEMRRPVRSDEPDDAAFYWHSTLVAADDEDRETAVATALTEVIHPNRLAGWSLPDVLDEISGDLADYTQLFDASGELLPDVTENYIVGLIVADRVTVEPAYRGHGLGPLLLGEALLDLGLACELAICTPAPFELDTEHAAEWDRRQAELRMLWSRLGFRRYGDTAIFVLDLIESTLEDAVRGIRASVYGS